MAQRYGVLLTSWILIALTAAPAFAQAPNPVIAGTDGAKMVLVPAGPFIIGTGEGLPDEAPPHRRDLPAFYIDACEVTAAQYAAFLKATGAAPPAGWSGNTPPRGGESLPITNISWFDAIRYAIWAGKRLPTEAEWEKAARGTDGRRFPWGNADDKTLRAIDTQKLEPVGSRPAGASPYGILDMSGNAWEFTADWYGGYPGTLARSVQFGQKYKVMRGGSAEYYYGLKNTGTTTLRCRILPYGTHDFVGFRCARSVDPAQSPYDPQKLLAETESRLNAALRQPIRLSYEDEFAAFLQAGRIPLRVAGQKGQSGDVRIGVPFPKGLLSKLDQVQVLSPDGTPRATQATMLATWEDGSVRWGLVDFTAAAGEICTLLFRPESRTSAPAQALRFTQQPDAIGIDTGTVALHITREKLLESMRFKDGQVAVAPMHIRMLTDGPAGKRRLEALPADTINLENAGPVCVTVHLAGSLGDGGKPSPFRYDLRIRATAGSSRLNLLLTLTHKAKRSITNNVQDACVEFGLAAAPAEIVLAADRGMHPLTPAKLISLQQVDDLHYEIARDGQKIAEGTRSDGWIALRSRNGWAAVGVADFWQNFPKALYATPAAVGIRLWSGPQPLDWEGGLAKTHEIVLDFTPQRPDPFHIAPLRVSLPPAWACGTDAMGAPMLPRGKEALERFPYWELFRQSGMQEWVRGMPTGFRHWGDSYMGGPYKGKNAYSNLEYDVHYNFLMEFLRTGDTWYLEAAQRMARHQADIDTDHFTGQPWKHSPQHTTTEAELGHVFLRGLLLHYLLTGERPSLDAAIEAGDWIAATLERGEGTGNERQIGWSLYALTALYDVTRNPKYLHACETLCNRLLRGQSATGQFTNIRWDNRISFFNGIAMNGMLTAYENNHDEKLAEGVMKVARRTLGMYPEYACRTLNAFIWAARRTNDPKFLDVIERTWELSCEYLPEAVTTETHAWHFRQFAARHDLFPLFAKPPAHRPDPATWQGLRFERGEVEIYLQPQADRPAPLLIVREGQAEGQAELVDAQGHIVQTLRLNDSTRVFEAATLALAWGQPAFRLRLIGPKARAWQIHHDAASRITAYDPAGAQIPDLYPRAFGFVEDGATEISIKLEATGEGFHMATLYDSEGKPVSTVRHFIDFEDPGRYELELKFQARTPFKAGAAPWSVEVYKLKVLGVKGMLPYWADAPQQLFHPERSGLLGVPLPLPRSAIPLH